MPQEPETQKEQLVKSFMEPRVYVHRILLTAYVGIDGIPAYKYRLKWSIGMNEGEVVLSRVASRKWGRGPLTVTRHFVVSSWMGHKSGDHQTGCYTVKSTIRERHLIVFLCYRTTFPYLTTTVTVFHILYNGM